MNLGNTCLQRKDKPRISFLPALHGAGHQKGSVPRCVLLGQVAIDLPSPMDWWVDDSKSWKRTTLPEASAPFGARLLVWS